ncbi:MAG: Fic family protein [Clostridia bacterium]|nr:Fic family protein [Clostridia bacterium]
MLRFHADCSVDDLLKAHGVMMRGLVDGAGYFRQKPVGVVDSKTGNVIHFGTLPACVPDAIYNLMDRTQSSELHPLVKSCVFHYEFELIHPFLDGNGRCGRLWHTLILSKWNSLFVWLPVESMVYQNQQEYYDTINKCNSVCDSTEFIEFMLDIIKSVLIETKETTCSKKTNREQDKEQVIQKILDYCNVPRTRNEIQNLSGIEGRKAFVSNYLKPLLESGKLAMTIPDKPTSRNQKYIAAKGDKR